MVDRFRIRQFLLSTAVASSLLSTSVDAAEPFANFESGHVRPLALAPLGATGDSLLFAVNTPDNRLEIFRAGKSGLEPKAAGSVAVGLEPVAVAARSPAEVWVVNHLSDSVSVVKVDVLHPEKSYVERTILLCDEPRDIVFAGSKRKLAFITTARRGPNCPVSPELTKPGIGRGVVQVFDAENLVAAPGEEHLGAKPLVNLVPLGDVLRPLAATPDGKTVYAGVFLSGNRTAAIHELVVTANGGLPAKPAGATVVSDQETGLIVKADQSGLWKEHLGEGSSGVPRDWSTSVRFDLPDHDVFVIDATKSPPAVVGEIDGVGTSLFHIVARQATAYERLTCLAGADCRDPFYVSNSEARNHVRFEPFLHGHVTESRITHVKANGSVKPRHLNPHIAYGAASSSAADIEKTIALPMGMELSNGGVLYLAAFGSEKVALVRTSDVDSDKMDKARLLTVGRGPTGFAVDDKNHRLFVMNRLDQTISVVENAHSPALASVSTTAVPLFDPSPEVVKKGRPFLYDAKRTSAHGDASCASCHLFGDLDGLAWDLGDPWGTSVPNPLIPAIGPLGSFHPMKGPMTTQSLRGLADAGPMHWRGDRFEATDVMDELGAFQSFNGAFETLLGRPGGPLPATDMKAFAEFALTLRYPPNPLRALDDSIPDQAALHKKFKEGALIIGSISCVFCHTEPLGTDGRASFDAEAQTFKVPHLRNLYQKVGMFGVPAGISAIPDTGPLGKQVRGFGFLHDGSIATLFDFLQLGVITFCEQEPNCDEATKAPQRRAMESFLLAFDTGTKPAVGQQVTVPAGASPPPGAKARLDLLAARHAAGDCELIARARAGNESRGYLYAGLGSFTSDRATDPPLTTANLLAAQTPVTFTCVPPGSGTRVGIDRDADGKRDGDDADPADPSVL